MKYYLSYFKDCLKTVSDSYVRIYFLRCKVIEVYRFKEFSEKLHDVIFNEIDKKEFVSLKRKYKTARFSVNYIGKNWRYL